MATRIALEREFAASPQRVFEVLSDRAFTTRRMALVPEMSAEVTSFAASPSSMELSVEAQLPASWMPAGVGGTPAINRHEQWTLKAPSAQPVAAGAGSPPTSGPPPTTGTPTVSPPPADAPAASPSYVGDLRLVVAGLPVTCGGEFTVHPWQEGSVASVVLDVGVDLPMVGPMVERMIRDRLEPAFAAELELLADAVEA